MGRPLILALLAIAMRASPPDRDVRIGFLEQPGHGDVCLTPLPPSPSGASMVSVASSSAASIVKRSEAQSGAATTAVQSAGMSGRVTDSSGQPVPGAMVIAVPTNGGAAAQAVSGPDGTYE